LILPKALPSADVTPLHRYYGLSDFLRPVLAASLLHLFANTPVLGECAGPPTFTELLLRHAVLSDPEKIVRLLPDHVGGDMVF